MNFQRKRYEKIKFNIIIMTFWVSSILVENIVATNLGLWLALNNLFQSLGHLVIYRAARIPWKMHDIVAIRWWWRWCRPTNRTKTTGRVSIVHFSRTEGRRIVFTWNSFLKVYCNKDALNYHSNWFDGKTILTNIIIQ